MSYDVACDVWLGGARDETEGLRPVPGVRAADHPRDGPPPGPQTLHTQHSSQGHRHTLLMSCRNS